MFAVGHLALGYLTGRTASKLLDVKANTPLLFLLSVLPDIDLLLGLEHRGPTHSLIVYIMIFVPLFWLYGKQVVPLFVSLTQHSLLGDLVTGGGGGVQILWPVVSEWYGVQMEISSVFNLSLEWVFFLMSMAILWKTGGLMSLFHHHQSNLLLTVPILTIILPTFLGFPLAVPPALIIPHLVFLAILVLSIIADLKQISKV